MAKTFEQECAEGRFEFNPNRSFEERCEIVRRTAHPRYDLRREIGDAKGSLRIINP